MVHTNVPQRLSNDQCHFPQEGARDWNPCSSIWKDNKSFKLFGHALAFPSAWNHDWEKSCYHNRVHLKGWNGNWTGVKKTPKSWKMAILGRPRSEVNHCINSLCLLYWKGRSVSCRLADLIREGVVARGRLWGSRGLVLGVAWSPSSDTTLSLCV